MPMGAIFAFVQKSVSKVLKTWYFAYSAYQLGGLQPPPPPWLRYWLDS